VWDDEKHRADRIAAIERIYATVPKTCPNPGPILHLYLISTDREKTKEQKTSTHIGCTADIQTRILQHNNKKNAPKATKANAGSWVLNFVALVPPRPLRTYSTKDIKREWKQTSRNLEGRVKKGISLASAYGIQWMVSTQLMDRTKFPGLAFLDAPPPRHTVTLDSVCPSPESDKDDNDGEDGATESTGDAINRENENGDENGNENDNENTAASDYSSCEEEDEDDNEDEEPHDNEKNGATENKERGDGLPTIDDAKRKNCNGVQRYHQTR
jgi:predicted GIY-YIG superfamily endonuclease